jgi:hypothetical protein
LFLYSLCVKGAVLVLPLFKSISMIYLTTNTANQTVFLSLDEARQYFATAFTHYLIIITHEENSTTGTVTTVGLTLAGRYRYVVYGQNSSSNINPTTGSVVGVVQRGYVVLTDNEQFYNVPSEVISNDIIYGA